MHLTATLMTIVASTVASSVSFLSVGDWGGYNLGSYHKTNVEGVSSRMTKDSRLHQYNAVLNTGDNFYYCGIQDLNDTNIQPDYIKTFGNINLPWISALGNHDYGYNVSAQLDLSSRIPNWVMPSRYYKQTYGNVNIFVLDTNPCIQGYRSTDPAKWDPCGTEYPTCTPYTNPIPCKFHENIISQSCSTQSNWLKKELDNLANNTSQWVVMIGHHPVYEIDDITLAGLIDSYADLYISGHIHLLATYTYNKHSKYVINGAGSMVYAGASLNTSVLDWYKQESGYARHHIQLDSIVTEFINSDGTLIHSLITYKH